MDMKWEKVIVHASPLFGLPIIVPLLFYFLSRHEEVKRLSIQALLFQFIMTVLIIVSSLLSIILIGIPFLIIFGLMIIIVPIIGIVTAIQDTHWEYPIVKRWV
mgnify:CR=1 FL=1